MVSWRCPHCGTPQQEAARCWVCHRSTTSCSTCRHYRRGVTAKLGYCALDKRRTVLTGAEERACWEPSARDTRTPEDTATTPVVPWADAETTETTEIEREVTAANAARMARAGRPDVRRIGLGLLDDGEYEAAEPDEFDGSSVNLAAAAPETLPSDDLWSLYLAGPSPLFEHRREPADTTVRSAGMWVETFKSAPAMPPPQAPLTARHRNVRSVRHRPWGPVPGHDAYVRSLRVPEKVKRPGL